jgi:spermidine synthase
VGVIGLGAGGLAAYARPTEHWTFYEIDPIVIRLATDPAYFSFLSDMFPDPSRLSIVLGDARVELVRAPEHGYGLLVLDAFSSDAIPMHLVTREALSLYLDKLAPDGILALHISNQYLDLHPVFADLAADASLVAWARDDQTLTPLMEQDGKSGSQWIAMARTAASLAPLVKLPGWARLEAQPGRKLWTDDFSDLLGVYRW